MADFEKIRIRKLDEKSDHCLWRFWVEANIDSKG